MILCSIFLPVYSFKGEKQKLCINCKYFKKNFLSNNKIGKCSLFPREETNRYHLVDGSPNIPEIEYTYCSIAREHDYMCGKTGTLFVKKEWPIIL
jgi:hypothetical protein